MMRTLCTRAMTYSIFDSTGNLVEAFIERGPALDYLAGIAQAEPAAADEVYLLAQDDTGNFIGEPIYASSVSLPA